MEQRYKMSETLAEVKGDYKEGDYNAFYLKGEKCIYVGNELALEDNWMFTWYFSPIDENTAFVFLYCGEDTFDKFIQLLDRTNCNAVEKAWPLLAQALFNGIHDNYGYPALIQLESIENMGATFWCLAQMFENFDFRQMDNWVGDYAMGKVRNLLVYYLNMFHEMKENKPSTIDLIIGTTKEAFRIQRLATTFLNIGSTFLGLPSMLGSGDEN